MEKVGKGEGVSFTMECIFPLRDKRKKKKKEKITTGDKARNGKVRLVLKSVLLLCPFKLWPGFLSLKFWAFFLNAQNCNFNVHVLSFLKA